MGINGGITCPITIETRMRTGLWALSRFKRNEHSVRAIFQAAGAPVFLGED